MYFLQISADSVSSVKWKSIWESWAIEPWLWTTTQSPPASYSSEKKNLCLIKLSRERRQNLPHFWIMKRKIVFCFVFHLEQVWILFVTVDALALATVNIHGRWYSIGQHLLLKVQSYYTRKKSMYLNFLTQKIWHILKPFGEQFHQA